MPVAWPPPAAPKWPPPGYGGRLEFATLNDAQQFCVENGWTVRAATAKEQRDYFTNARCDDGHQVTGALLVTNTGAAYPFAVCLGPAGLRVFLVLWGPDFVWGST